MCALYKKWAVFDPFSPVAKTAGTSVFPDTALLRFLLSPTTQIMS